MKVTDKSHGGKADNMTVKDVAKKHKVPVGKIKGQIRKGIKIEREHTNDTTLAKEISKDHLEEFPDYYTRLDRMEEQAKKELGKEAMEKQAFLRALYRLMKKRMSTPPASVMREIRSSGKNRLNVPGSFRTPAMVPSSAEALNVGGMDTLKKLLAEKGMKMTPAGKTIKKVAPSVTETVKLSSVKGNRMEKKAVNIMKILKALSFGRGSAASTAARKSGILNKALMRAGAARKGFTELQQDLAGRELPFNKWMELPKFRRLFDRLLRTESRYSRLKGKFTPSKPGAQLLEKFKPAGAAGAGGLAGVGAGMGINKLLDKKSSVKENIMKKRAMTKNAAVMADMLKAAAYERREALKKEASYAKILALLGALKGGAAGVPIGGIVGGLRELGRARPIDPATGRAGDKSYISSILKGMFGGGVLGAAGGGLLGAGAAKAMGDTYD